MRRRAGIITGIYIMCIVLAFCITGCFSGTVQASDEQGSAQGVYRIYYTNPEKTALVRHEYKTKSEDFEGILTELMDAFRTPDSSDVKSALPEQVEINSTGTGINEIDVDFNVEYLSLDPISELLLRGALVETLLQIPGVDTVRFTVESQNLVIGEREVGPMTEDTFIVPDGNGINSYLDAVLTLYFPSGDGTTLTKENRTVYYSSNVNKERLVIEQMLNGPQTSDLLPVALEGTLVQDVSVSNGYCIVDFSEEINSTPPGEVIANSESVLYAFTDAIIDSCPDDRITGVRFRIEGSSDVRFRDQVNLDQIFSRNSELIEAPVVQLEEPAVQAEEQPVQVEEPTAQAEEQPEKAQEQAAQPQEQEQAAQPQEQEQAAQPQEQEQPAQPQEQEQAAQPQEQEQPAQAEE